MRLRNATKLHRKSGVWGTPVCGRERSAKSSLECAGQNRSTSRGGFGFWFFVSRPRREDAWFYVGREVTIKGKALLADQVLKGDT
jgi:hypothetical protein